MFKFYNIIIITLLRIYVEYTVFLPPFTSSSFGGQHIRCVKRVAGIQSCLSCANVTFVGADTIRPSASRR